MELGKLSLSGFESRSFHIHCKPIRICYKLSGPVYSAIIADHDFPGALIDEYFGNYFLVTLSSPWSDTMIFHSVPLGEVRINPELLLLISKSPFAISMMDFGLSVPMPILPESKKTIRPLVDQGDLPPDAAYCH